MEIWRNCLAVVAMLCLWSAHCTQNPNIITTQMTINGIKYDAVCDCGKEITDQIKSVSEIKCTPTKIKIRQDKTGVDDIGTPDINLDGIRDFVGKPGDIIYTNPQYASFRCVDGRISYPALYTLGGDAGEFVLGLVIYEELKGSELSQDEVRNLFTRYLETMDHDEFYWCTDDIAVNHIQQMIQEYDINIVDPRPDLQFQILDVIADPANIGDVHFKTLLNEYERLNIRRELVAMFIRTFYEVLWDHHFEYSYKITHEQLVGAHKETTFMDIRNDKDCNAPMMQSNQLKTLGISAYLNHQEASKIRRSQMAYYFTTQLNHNTNREYNVQLIEHRFDNHALAFLERTGTSVARNLPFYTLLFV